MFKFLTTFFFLLLVSITFSQSIKKESWINDLHLYQKGLEENHIDLYNKISSVEFTRDLEFIKSTLFKKTDIEIIIDLMKLTKKIGDGHTSISLRSLEKHFYPIEIFKIDGQWRVIKTTKEHKSLLGTTLIEIDGHTIEQVEREIGEIAQYVENKQSQVFRTGQYAMISELLYGLNLTNNLLGANFTFLDKNNKKLTKYLNGIHHKTYYEQTVFQTLEPSVPEIEKPANTKHDFLWFSPIKNVSGVYIRFESYPSFEDMEAFGTSVLNYINIHKVRKVIIDLRNNGGGDFFVGTFLAYYLNLADSIDFKSGVYVLTDRVTFSAGTSNASQFRQILNAKIIGEPTGSNPSGYQDMGQFSLPNSNVVVTYSKRQFMFQENITQGVQPDIRLKYNWENYANGKDNMLEWIIDDIKSANTNN